MQSPGASDGTADVSIARATGRSRWRDRPARVSAAPHNRFRPWLVPILAGAALLLLIASVATIIVAAESSARARLGASIRQRDQASARFFGQYLMVQVRREESVARASLARPTVSASTMRLVCDAFGFSSAAVLDRGGMLGSCPGAGVLAGLSAQFTGGWLTRAELGIPSVSGVLFGPANTGSTFAEAVPFPAADGTLRVLVGTVKAKGGPAASFAANAADEVHHSVYLVDDGGRILAASPATDANTLLAAAPALARSVRAQGRVGVVASVGSSTYVEEPVPGVPYRLLLVVPNADLGLSAAVLWTIFGLVAGLAGLLMLLLLRVLRQRRALSTFSEKMAEAAGLDALTGLASRWALVQRIEQLTAMPTDEVHAVLMVDLDKLKQLNDSFGHHAGDQALLAIAAAMRQVFGTDGLYGRWGGDEFLAILAQTSVEEAAALAERLIARVEALNLSFGDDGTPIRVSVGCAAGQGDFEQLLQQADADLYRAKAAAGELAEVSDLLAPTTGL